MLMKKEDKVPSVLKYMFEVTCHNAKTLLITAYWEAGTTKPVCMQEQELRIPRSGLHIVQMYQNLREHLERRLLNVPASLVQAFWLFEFTLPRLGKSLLAFKFG